MVYMTIVTSLLASCNNADGEIRLKSTTLPEPLGHYVEFANDRVPIEIGEPDSEGDVPVTLYFDFNILRHASQMQYLSFKGDILSRTRKGLGELKFKKDQDAVASLANAIASASTERVTVPFKMVLQDVEVGHLLNDAEVLSITESTIYRVINKENFRVGGKYSSAIRLKRNDSCCRIFMNDDFDNEVNCNIDIELLEDIDFRGEISLNILTETGQRLISLTPRINRDLLLANQYSDISYSFKSGQAIDYQQLDALLNKSLIFELRLDPLNPQ